MRKLRVLIIAQKVDISDSVLGFFCDWLNGLAEKLDKVYVVSLKGSDSDLASNIELYTLDKGSGGSKLARFFRFNRCLAKFIFNKKVNIIFIHMCPEYVLLASLYAKVAHIPIVMWYAHGNVNTNLRIAHFLADKVVSSTKDGFRINSKKLNIVGQGVDLEKFRPGPLNLKSENERKLILSAGRISPVKNYETLIKAVDILINQKKIRDFKLQIVGGVPIESQKRYSDSLKDMVKRYELEDYVQFAGPIAYTQIHSYYQNCDLFVSASNTGSLDKAVLEAMASGKIVLTSNEAFSDLLKDYSSFLMFDKNNPNSLVEKIIHILEMKETKKLMINNYLRQILLENHNIDILVNRLVKIFREISDERQKNAKRKHIHIFPLL